MKVEQEGASLMSGFLLVLAKPTGSQLDRGPVGTQEKMRCYKNCSLEQIGYKKVGVDKDF